MTGETPEACYDKRSNLIDIWHSALGIGHLTFDIQRSTLNIRHLTPATLIALILFKQLRVTLIASMGWVKIFRSGPAADRYIVTHQNIESSCQSWKFVNLHEKHKYPGFVSWTWTWSTLSLRMKKFDHPLGENTFSLVEVIDTKATAPLMLTVYLYLCHWSEWGGGLHTMC